MSDNIEENTLLETEQNFKGINLLVEISKLDSKIQILKTR